MRLTRACVWASLTLLAPPALADEDYISAEALREAGFVKGWQLPLRLEKDQRFADIYLMDDALYLATNDGYVFALHAETGAHRWMRQVTREGYRVRRPCHAGERVIFATPTTVLQLNRRYGDGEYRHELSFPAGTAPVTDGVRVFLGGLDRRMYAFEIENPLYNWKVLANGPISSTPAVFEGNLAVASDDGTVFSCTAGRKAFRWQGNVYGSVTADLAVNDRGVYVACRDQSLYLLDPLFGEIRWRARFSGALHEAPTLSGELAYQFCPDDGLVAVNTAVIGVEERLRWKLPRGRMVLTTDARYAYVMSVDQTILVVGLADGKVAYTLPAAGLTLGTFSAERPAIYLASPEGRVFCARPRGTPPVTQADLRDALNPPETQPAEPAEKAAGPAGGAGEEKPDPLSTARKGVPIGGKSKVSKGFGKSGGGEGGSK